MGRYVLAAVLIGLLMMTPTCPAAPVEGEHDLSFVLSNLTALWEEVHQLRHEVEDQRRGGSPHDQATREVDVMKHEELVHHYYRPHQGHNDHHDPALLQHLEHYHNHSEDTDDHSRDHHPHPHHHHHRGHDHHHHHPHHRVHDDHNHHKGHDHHHQNDTTHDHEGHDHSRDDHRHAKQNDDEGQDQSGEDDDSSEEKESPGHDHSGDDHDHSGDDHDHSGDDHSADHHHRDEGREHSHHDHDDDHHHHHHHHHGKDTHDLHGLHTPAKGAPLPRPVVAGSVLVPKIGLALIPERGEPQAADQDDEWMHAICSLEPNADVENGTVRGTVVISQKKDESGPVFFNINIHGFKPLDGRVHGFHIHASPVIDNSCVTAGSHLNPFGTDHGGPDSEIRHVGDLGNIEVDSDGKLEDYILSDNIVAFKGPASIIGKAIVVHAGEDDLGLGGDESSLTTGNAGGRLACCNIHIQAETLYRFKG